jgi:hypothetical protein
LAVSLEYHNSVLAPSYGPENDDDDHNPIYKFHQGTAMGRPSLIAVEGIRFEKEDEHDGEDEDSSQRRKKKKTSAAAAGPTTPKRRTVSFKLLGKVEIDDRETIEL